MRFILAIRLFFRTLFDATVADRLRQALESPEAARLPPPSVEKPPVTAARPAPIPGRSEAITLLAALQREARLIDIVKEPLHQYSDAQIGAAAREVLRDCATVLDRMFGIEPLLNQPEGSEVEVPRGYDPIRYRLSGKVSGEPPFRGAMVHHGWIAQRCELPEWSGDNRSANVVAPTEVELN